MLTFGLEEERMLAPDVQLTLGTGGLVDLADLGRRGDRIADDSPADMLHDVRHGAVAVDHHRLAGVFRLARLVRV